ncbi:MAG: Glutamyl-tRNA(Gln) amidotransferase subunit E [Methanomassiliicoccales archaeon PtaU1.Bin124]|nr:MAG: Glutamyl-tRNA(Gln) amidotransferase subunit E [Methanomassiliicoccales archaeon PtaU1.Bin124]
MTDRVTVGLEIHQQLSTNKLFCSCQSELVEDAGPELQRRLRPTQSELGEIDRAALAQAERKMHYRYQCPSSRCCLVEADEEPPHDADAVAMQTTLTVSEMMGCKVVDEVHFMRKIVVDGSNTSGFQRTALVAVDGEIDVNGKRIKIQSVCLEEDAARKVETKGSEITYRLDRLGIPLIEIATGPDMHDPEEVKEVAAKLGSILRATRKVKRGLGTIREDLNVSIPGGARVEVKGVQDLRLLPTYVEKEIERQTGLLKVKETLIQRGVSSKVPEIVDCSGVLKDCRSKVIAGALGKGGKVFGVPLPGFEGLMKSPDAKLRLGAEMAQYAKTKGVAGIFHTDELPGYGITAQEVDAIRAHLGLKEGQAFAICADDPVKAEPALRLAVVRAYMAPLGVPEETRDPLPDGGTAYSRPLPGAGRMYPETDVRPITIGPERLEETRAHLPELPEAKVARFVSKHGVHEQQARQLVRDGWEDLFEEMAEKGQAAVAARTFLSTFSELEKEGAVVGNISDDSVRKAFAALSQGKFAKEALPDIFRQVASGAPVDDVIGKLGDSSVSAGEAEGIVDKIIQDRADFVRQKGVGAVGPLMSFVMGELKGKVDGKQASDLLKRRIEAFLKQA